MDSKRELIFSPLRYTLETQRLADFDLFEVIGNFAETHPPVAKAMAFHARDFLKEQGDADVTYGIVVAEVYRRTFFDPEFTHKYGTENVMSTDDVLQDFVNHMVAHYNMDLMQSERGSFFAPPQGHQ